MVDSLFPGFLQLPRNIYQANRQTNYLEQEPISTLQVAADS